MSEKTIDLNCDTGESYGNFRIGMPEALFSLISSCNIACGFHGGDPRHIEETIDLATEHRVTIGAHPSYPDLMGFGRRSMQIAPQELKSIVKYQVAALKGLVESKGGALKYVKPHGALYHDAIRSAVVAGAICQAMHELDPELALLALAGSPVQDHASEYNIRVLSEAFADRRYSAEGYLVRRSVERAVIHDPEEAAKQVTGIVMDHAVKSIDGERISLRADSICIHGDHAEAVPIARAVRQALEENGVTIKSPFAS